MVLNEGLKEQVVEQAESCGIDITCILPPELNIYIEEDKLGEKYGFILDEYYEMISCADMSNLIINRLPGIFTVGWHHRAVFATGHISP